MSATAKYLYQDGQKFFARGVSYGPFAPNSRGESYPEPERAAADLALMGELGANLIRTYTMPPAWMFEQAAKHQLLLMPGISWPLHLTFLDSPEMAREIRATIRREVAALRPFTDMIFAYGLGNEIRSDIVRWHGPRAVSRFLGELYDSGKQLDPEGLFTYCNYPSTEYLDLSFLDVVCFNVYLHREPDFRRYLTHLMAITGDRPLVLSETGIDTIREGEDHQAELLQWQSRATFELGLSGLVIFAFTDEWFRGGSEILDWAFGIASRERVPKAAFAPLRKIFHGSLPPPLTNPPNATVVVPAYNAAAHIGQCLTALKELSYPDYEILVVDNGSTDATAAIAESARVRTLKLVHRGLAAARNAGIEAARGRLVAFIDADAEADPDWLYHLAETAARRNSAAVGGQSFAPKGAARLGAVIGHAPGQPHEVRLGDQDLAQLCGCNMAIDKANVDLQWLFDPMFTSAGDDVDFSWRLRDSGMTLAYAPGAIVLHQPRNTFGGYLKQQLGYGHAEGLLYRKYPNRARDGVYQNSGWLPKWLGGGQRIYYGGFGRGLFQTIYPGSPDASAALLPMTFQWIAAALVLTGLGTFNRIFAALGIIGLLLTIVGACAGAIASPDAGGLANRASLVLLWILGPLVRSWERERVKWSFHPDTSGATTSGTTALRGIISSQSGGLSVPEEQPRAPADTAAIEERIAALHVGLVRRGLIVGRGTDYDSYDLRIIVPPWMRLAIVHLAGADAPSIGWRIGVAGARIGFTLGALFVLLLIAGVAPAAAAAAALAAGAIIVAFSWMRARRVPAVISAAAADLSRAVRGKEQSD